jgi:prepilin peptidase CpaA
MSHLFIRTALWAAVLLTLIASARIDFRARIIPNGAVLFIAACGIALGLVTRPGSVWVSLLVSVVLFCGLWILANYDFLGGGDAKLVAAVTLLVPPDRIGMLLIEIALAGGMVSGAYLAAARIRRRVRNTVPIPAACRSGRRNRLLRSECARITYESSVPYALAVLGGVGFYVVSELSRCLFATFCSL